MNLLKLSLFSLLVVAFAACKKDKDSTPTCTQADWVGTYEGSIVCDGTTETVTVTIVASGADAIVIEYETATSTTTYDPLTPTNCTITESGTDSGITYAVDASLDKDKFTIKETYTVAGATSICDLTATRK